ncbi:MAG: YggS family pyridoxal phosphate-dependent enzyme [Methylophilus sp.]|jgi:hypothetical protein
MNNFVNTLQAIHARIEHAKVKVARNDTISLCAVSKSQNANKLRAAYEAGQTIFGENYLQEAIAKQTLLQDCNIEWHFIGPIQSNKTQQIAQHFDWVQSVDRLKIAQRLSAARPAHLAPLNICLQINSSGETTKSGTQTSEIINLALAVINLPNIRLRGIMAIPAPSTDRDIQYAQFRAVNEAYIELKKHVPQIDTLSIGMSDDFEVAIEVGATLVRIGSAIFGARVKKDHI